MATQFFKGGQSLLLSLQQALFEVLDVLFDGLLPGNVVRSHENCPGCKQDRDDALMILELTSHSCPGSFMTCSFSSKAAVSMLQGQSSVL